MKNNMNNETLIEYELKDIVNYCSTDPKGLVKDSKNVYLPKALADELNYARALNNDPLRLVEVEPSPV